jgi:hypothetical protein
MLLQAQIDMLHAAAERKDTTLLQIFVGAVAVSDEHTLAYILSKTEWHTAELFGKENLVHLKAAAEEFAADNAVH